jgi:acetoacetate decarboxylase
VIPVRFRAADGTVEEGGYVHAMYLDDNSPIAGGREIWGFPKKLANPKIAHESETLVCTLHYGSVLCVSATMGYKHRELDPVPLLKSLAKPNFMIKIIPHVDCTPRICELVRYYLEGVTLRRVVRARSHRAFRARDVQRRPPARARRGCRQPFCHRPDAWPRRGDS